MTEGLAICLLSALLILLQLIDSFTLYKGLTHSGISTELAKNAKGIYDRGQPLIQLGMIVATAFSTTLMPVLSRAVIEKRETEFLRSASSMVRMTLTFSIAATTGLIVLMPYINQVLFGDRSGVGVLSVYMLAILFASLIGTYNALGLILSVIRLGLPHALKKEYTKKSFALKLVIISLTMSVIVWGATRGIEAWFLNGGHRTDAFVLTLLGVIIGISVFLFGLFRLNVLTIREWLSLPFGKKMLRKQVK